MDFFIDIRNKFIDILKEYNINTRENIISTISLTPNEAIGEVERDDYPILKGREVLINSSFNGFIGQAFTDSPKTFKGTLNDVLNLDLKENFNRAIFIASLNAVLKSLGLIENTVHCKNKEPKMCATKMLEFFKKNYKSNTKILLVGLQPGILNELSSEFNIRVLDLDDDNIGCEKSGVLIEDGEASLNDALNWCDVILATGSTSSNGSIVNFLNLNKPTYFFGTTVSGIAYIKKLNRLCFLSL